MFHDIQKDETSFKAGLLLLSFRVGEVENIIYGFKMSLTRNSMEINLNKHFDPPPRLLLLSMSVARRRCAQELLQR